jgi:anti-anti-sigma regulatory factor
MTSTTESQKPDIDEKLAERLQILAISIASVTIFAWGFTNIVIGAMLQGSGLSQTLLASTALLASGLLYVCARTRYARMATYFTFYVCIGVLSLMTSASRIQAGGSWVLFQIIPPLAGLILRERYASISIAIISIAVLIGTYTLQISEIFVVNLMLPVSLLNYNLSMQIGTMICLSIMTEIIVRKEREALQQAQQAQAETSLQLERVNELLIEQKRLNSDLEESLLAIQMRDKQLAEEQSQRQELRRTIANMSAPIVPIMEGVAVVPLVGSFDQERLLELEKVVANGMQKDQIRVPIIDITGVNSVPDQFSQDLAQLVKVCRRNAESVVLVGDENLLSETVNFLGNKKHIHVISNLQDAIRYVMGLKERERKA